VELRHFWFTDWTDHKAPDDAGSLVSMAEEVEQLRLESGATCVQTEELEAATRPVAVHCSAGIGRTGCFVAVATGMRQLSGEANVDILGIVCAMRQDR
jgi:receptor-type tyrosine-protein phosphatase R